MRDLDNKRALDRKYYQENKEARKDYIRNLRKDPQYVKLQRHYNKVAKVRKLNRIPIWADIEKIKDIYLNCPDGMVVDHVVPLQSKYVSGLHVENNLQYLSPEDNVKKGKNFENIHFEWQDPCIRLWHERHPNYYLEYRTRKKCQS